jgi:hypothetical protein
VTVDSRPLRERPSDQHNHCHHLIDTVDRKSDLVIPPPSSFLVAGRSGGVIWSLRCFRGEWNRRSLWRSVFPSSAWISTPCEFLNANRILRKLPSLFRSLTHRSSLHKHDIAGHLVHRQDQAITNCSEFHQLCRHSQHLLFVVEQEIEVQVVCTVCCRTATTDPQ